MPFLPDPQSLGVPGPLLYPAKPKKNGAAGAPRASSGPLPAGSACGRWVARGGTAPEQPAAAGWRSRRRRCPSPHMPARATMVAAEVEGMCRHVYVPICPQQPCSSGTCFMAEQRCSWLTCCPRRPRHHGEPAAHLCRAAAGPDVIVADVRGRGSYPHRLRDPRAAQRRQPGCSPLGRCQDPNHPDGALEHEGDHVELSVLWPLPHHFGHRVSLLGLWDVRGRAVLAGEPRVGYAQRVWWWGRRDGDKWKMSAQKWIRNCEVSTVSDTEGQALVFT